MTEKYLRITMPDESKWDVPAKIIADNRAVYYAKKETKEEYEKIVKQTGIGGSQIESNVYGKIYDTEFKEAMSDDYVLHDWASNNMNWEDVKDTAKEVKLLNGGQPAVDYQEGWINGEYEVVSM